MSAKVIPLQRWLQCFQEATRDLVSVSMRFDGAPPAKGKPAQARPGGAYIHQSGEMAEPVESPRLTVAPPADAAS